jgi:hypothetical protein
MAVNGEAGDSHPPAARIDAEVIVVIDGSAIQRSR